MYGTDQKINGIAQTLSQDDPADSKTLERAISETYEQYEQGLPVPNDHLLTVEEWDDFIIVNSHMGTLVNRTLARLIGHLLSDEAGVSVGIQQDPYRIVFQAVGGVRDNEVVKMVRRLSEIEVDEVAITACKTTGLFKRRLVHVARRFGAIPRWTMFSSITLRQIAKSFERTDIIDEAVRETLERDMDIPHTKEVLHAIARHEIQLKVVKTVSGEATPIARIGLER